MIHYGEGGLYGEIGSNYGSIPTGLAGAQATQVRETGLRVRIIDERVNRWEYFAGENWGSGQYAQPGVIFHWEQAYWTYRGQADVCVLSNGNIVRVRLNPASRDVEIQTITDPTVAAQWESWSTYNSDDNFAVAVAPDGTSPIVYHAKADGVYRNNSLEWSKDNVISIKCHKEEDNKQQPEVLWIQRVSEGVIHDSGRLIRKIDVYFTPDIQNTTPDFVNWNYMWAKNDVVSIQREDNKQIRLSSFPQYASLAGINTGESLVTTIFNDFSGLDDAVTPRLVRSAPGDLGRNSISHCRVSFHDGFYWVFYQETHLDEELEPTSNLGYSMVWQRSRDGLIWSEPVNTGFGVTGFAGLVYDDDYLYMCGNGIVYRRPRSAIEYDISNYVTGVSFDSPAQNQEGSGQIQVANPAGINDYLLDDHIDRRVIIEPGLKIDDGTYQFGQFDDHWIKNVHQELNGTANRLTIQIGNIWARLSVPLRDTYNFIGRTIYEDWKEEGTPNQPFAYYFVDGEMPDFDSQNLPSELTATGVVLWTGWKGFNPFVQVELDGTGDQTIYYRYIDENNHMKVVFNGSIAVAYAVVDGTETAVGDSVALSPSSSWGIRVVWKIIEIWEDGVALVDWAMDADDEDTPSVYKPGYVGFRGGNGEWTLSNFEFQDQEYNYKTVDLVRQALALGDYHDAIISVNADQQYNIIWGPQTDIPTGADALRILLEADKSELIWRYGVIEIGRFASLTPVKTLQDEIISTTLDHEGNRQINLAQVDGNEYPWTQVDGPDARMRDRMINAYFDLPELKDEDTVRSRAEEEIRRSQLAKTPGGDVPLLFDLNRMDPVLWIDNLGNEYLVRIEGMQVSINQSTTPHQRQTLDTSLIDDA